jgi:hypothetical protein
MSTQQSTNLIGAAVSQFIRENTNLPLIAGGNCVIGWCRLTVRTAVHRLPAKYERRQRTPKGGFEVFCDHPGGRNDLS